jgi:D-serine deaminase-like pyridoxal phosphate-dependent protein
VRPALKTLEVPQLCAYVLQRLPQPLGLIHHLRTVDQVVPRTPAGTDLLMGYPPTVGELRAFLARRGPKGQRTHRLRLTVDALGLLEELGRLARTTPRPLPLDLCLEIDSGAGRGGFAAGPGLAAAIAVLRRERRTLRLGALLCYDAGATVNSEATFRSVVARYAQDRVREAREQLRAEAADLYDDDALIVNGPGTANFREWLGKGVANEMSPGSAFLVPGYVDGFDKAFVRAHALAAPVLRVTSDGPSVPLLQLTPPGAGREEVLIKAGGWPTGNNPKLSRLVWPEGLDEDAASGGRGANSSGAITAPKGALRLGDVVLLHAEQITEALDYFGSVVAIREGTVRRVWPNVTRWGGA